MYGLTVCDQYTVYTNDYFIKYVEGRVQDSTVSLWAVPCDHTVTFIFHTLRL